MIMMMMMMMMTTKVYRALQGLGGGQLGREWARGPGSGEWGSLLEKRSGEKKHNREVDDWDCRWRETKMIEKAWLTMNITRRNRESLQLHGVCHFLGFGMPRTEGEKEIMGQHEYDKEEHYTYDQDWKARQVWSTLLATCESGTGEVLIFLSPNYEPHEVTAKHLWMLLQPDKPIYSGSWIREVPWELIPMVQTQCPKALPYFPPNWHLNLHMQSETKIKHPLLPASKTAALNPLPHFAVSCTVTTTHPSTLPVLHTFPTPTP